MDETTTFNVVLSYLHINLKICSVSESVNFGFSTTEVSIPVLRKHTKVSMAEPTHCNILILCQLTMHDYTKYLTIFGRIPIRQLYCKKLLFKEYVIPVVILESPDDCGLADHHSTLKVLLLTCSQRSGRQGTYLISRQSGGHGLGAHQTSHAGDNSYSPPRSSSLRLRRDPL